MADTDEPQPAVDDVYFEDQVHRNQRIQDMAATEGWAIVVEQAAADVERTTQALVGGYAKNWDDYKRLTEVAKSIQTLIDIPVTSQRTLNDLRRQRAEDRPVDDDE